MTLPSRRAFTLAELLVVVAVIAILAGIVLSVVRQAGTRSQSVQCVANLRQWGVALNLYAADHNNYLPRRGQGVNPLSQLHHPSAPDEEDWFNVLPPYLGLPGLLDAVNAGTAPKPGDRSVFVCPTARSSTSGQYFLPYAMNMYLSTWNASTAQNRAAIDNPATLAFMTDGPVAWSSTVPSSQGYSVQARHGGQANVCFVDGHVASFDGTYLGCGTGEPTPQRGDVHWQTDLPNGQTRIP